MGRQGRQQASLVAQQRASQYQGVQSQEQTSQGHSMALVWLEIDSAVAQLSDRQQTLGWAEIGCWAHSTGGGPGKASQGH